MRRLTSEAFRHSTHASSKTACHARASSVHLLSMPHRMHYMYAAAPSVSENTQLRDDPLFMIEDLSTCPVPVPVPVP